MTSHQEILREIQRITGKLISIGLSVAQNFPTTAFVRDSGQIIAYEAKVLNVKILRIVVKLCISIGDTKFE